MKKAVKNSLRSMLIEAASFRRLPLTVIRQLVGYYGDWRHARDIIPDVLDTSNGTRSARGTRLFGRASRTNPHTPIPHP